jgi:hypothetical protein
MHYACNILYFRQSYALEDDKIVPKHVVNERKTVLTK